MAQRLVRTIDSDNKEPYKPTDNELNQINVSKANAKKIKFFTGKPTSNNHNTGYKGRTAIHEILEVNSDMKNLIFDNASANDIKELAVKNGMTPLREAGVNKVKDGVTTIEEILRATVEDV